MGGGGVRLRPLIDSLFAHCCCLFCLFVFFNEFLQVPTGGLGEKTPKIRRKISSSEAAVCPVGGN